MGTFAGVELVGDPLLAVAGPLAMPPEGLGSPLPVAWVPGAADADEEGAEAA
jgi:hypothetical protein